MVSVQAAGEFLKKGTTSAVLVIAVSLLAGCASNKAVTPLSMASTEPLTGSAALAEARALNMAYKKNPDDVAIALKFARSLEAMGSKKEAVAVLAATADRQPGDRLIMAAYGKSLLGVGRPGEAVKVLGRARTLDAKDWRIVSALGLAHDQMKRHSEARKFYASAAKLAPGEASIHNNIGLSYALDKDLVSAEKALRIAAQMKGAEPRIRQNLALVVGLQGRFEEAKKISSSELPKDLAAQNTAYLRNMLAEPNAWRQIAEADEDMPAVQTRRYKRTIAAVPARKPVDGAVDGSVGGPLFVIKPSEMAPEAVVLTEPDPEPLRTGLSIEWPTGMLGKNPRDERKDVVVAAKLPASHRRLLFKGGGVPQ